MPPYPQAQEQQPRTIQIVTQGAAGESMRGRGAKLWAAALACAVGVATLNGNIHFNDPVDRIATNSDFVGVDVRTQSGYIGELGMYAIGRGQKDVTILPDPYAIAVADAKVGLYYPEMAKLKFNFNGEKLVVSGTDDSGNQVGVDANKVVMEPYLGSMCQSSDSNGFRVFTCDNVDKTSPNFMGRNDIVGDSAAALIVTDDEILNSALTSLRLFLTDRYCLEKSILEPQGVTLQMALQASIREYLFTHYDIPPSVVTFFKGPLSLNTDTAQPISERLKQAQKIDPQVQNPTTSNDPTVLNSWCSLTSSDGFKNLHSFVDQDSLAGFIKLAKAWGGETVDLGVYPDANGDVKLDPGRDIARRQELPAQLANNEITIL